MLTQAADERAADWLIDRWGDFGELIPRGFAACVRVFHPAFVGPWSERRPVRWADVAAANGTTPHARMEFNTIARRPLYDISAQPGVFDYYPTEDLVPDEFRLAIIEVLERHTTTKDSCFFGLWVGYASLSEAERAAPRFQLPHRGYHLFSGPIAAVAEFEQGPNLWWPSDHAWCVASDTDLMTTYIGGDHGLVADAVASPQLEAYEVSPQTGFDHRGDDVNPA